MLWIAHYRLNKDGRWLVYVNGEVVATVDNPEDDYKIRFADSKIVVVGTGKVNVDVREDI